MWTLEHDSTTQTFADWGLSDPVLTLANFAAGTVAMRLVADFDAAGPFAFGDAAIVRLDGTVVFRGRFARIARRGAANNEDRQYELRDAWWDMERRFYIGAQTFPALFREGDTIAEMLEAVVDAAQAAGIAIQFGAAANCDIAPLPMEARDLRYSDMLRALRRYIPDVQTWIDHTTTPPTIHFVRRADASALSLAITTLNEVTVSERPDMQVSAVVLRYASMAEGVTGPVESVATDKWPALATGNEEGAVVVTFDLRGPQVETQALATDNISSSSRAWWARRYPWLSPGNAGLEEGENFGFTNTLRLMQNVDGDWVTDTTGSVYEITDGGVPGWLSEARQVLVKATVEDFTLDGEHHASYELQTTVNATSLSGGVYTRQVAAAETVPTGIAQVYHGATSVLHFEGSLSYDAAEIALPTPHCAMVLNLTGGESAARGWTTMRAVIQSVTVDVHNARVSLQFGPPEHLGPQDLLELARMRGQARELDQRFSSTGGGGGIRRAGGSNTLPPKPSAGTAHPFFIYANGEMHAGTVNGEIPLLADEDIGVGGPALTLTVNGWVYIKVVIDCVFTAGHFLDSWQIEDSGMSTREITIVGSETPLTDSFNSGTGKLTTYRLLAQIVSGVVKRAQQTTSNLNLGVCDLSTGVSGGKNVSATWTSAGA